MTHHIQLALLGSGLNCSEKNCKESQDIPGSITCDEEINTSGALHAAMPIVLFIGAFCFY